MTEQDSESGLQESRTLCFKPSAQQRWSGGTSWRQWGSHSCFKGFSPPALHTTLALGLSMDQTPLRASSSSSPLPRTEQAACLSSAVAARAGSSPWKAAHPSWLLAAPHQPGPLPLPTTPSTTPVMASLVCHCPEVPVPAPQPTSSELCGS